MPIFPPKTRLTAFFRAGGGKPRVDQVAAMANIGPELVEHYGMSDAEVQHFLAQVGAESNGLSLVTENMRYTALRMVQVFGYRLRKYRDRKADLKGMSIRDVARRLEGRPDDIAEMAYGNRRELGNTSQGDGARYIGRGPTQITGKYNYGIIRDEIRKQPGGENAPDFVEKPRALEDPNWAIRSAFADWHLKGMRKIIRGRADDLERVSSMLNAGSPDRWNIVNGKQGRRRWYALAKSQIVEKGTALVAVNDLRKGDSGTEVRELQERLQALGYAPGAIDGKFGPLTRDAVLSLQATADVPTTGVVNDVTRAALESGVVREVGPREEAKAKDIKTPVTEAAKATSTNAKLAGASAIIVGVADQIPDLTPISDALGKVKPLANLISSNPWVLYAIGGGVVLFFLGRAAWSARKTAVEAVNAYRRGAYLG